MKTLYIDSVGGLAGDMFLAAALDAGFVTLAELQGIVSAWLPERVLLSSDEVHRNGMRARTFHVEVTPQGHEHHHRNLRDVERLLDVCPLPRGAVERARVMFRELAEAEARVHGAELQSIHFHEVGATDSLVDFALAAFVLEGLGARVEASAAIVGRGRVQMEHGSWPVPPPGTAELLRAGGVPVRALPPGFPWENAELTTPTGACLLRRASRFGDAPSGKLTAIGVGAGTLDIPGYPNVVRLLLFEAQPEDESPRFDTDRVAILETWIDDLPGNILAEAVEEMLSAGALDVAVSSATFKKGRVGYALEVISPLERAQHVASVILGRTTAIGLRARESVRWKLFRQQSITADGLPAKLVHDANGSIARLAPETDALTRQAKAGGAAPMFGWRIEDKRGKG